jgi:putative membrane protein
MVSEAKSKEQVKDPYNKLIIALSIIIPVVVALLFGMPKIEGYDLTFLPPIYATINGLTAVFLIMAVMAIKNGRRVAHERLIKICIGLSSLFLLMYIAYHVTTPSTKFGGEGLIRSIYFLILISHILLSIVVIPFVLFTYVRALRGNFEKHKALAKYTYPLWLYVAVTGVIVYIMISPYYAS